MSKRSSRTLAFLCCLAMLASVMMPVSFADGADSENPAADSSEVAEPVEAPEETLSEAPIEELPEETPSEAPAEELPAEDLTEPAEDPISAEEEGSGEGGEILEPALLSEPLEISPRAEEPTQGTAKFGTPALGTDDALWEETMALELDTKTNYPTPTQEKPHAKGVGRALWDEDFLYVRVEVTDADVYTGAVTSANNYNCDNIEFFVGAGSQGSNQWRINADGSLSGANAEGRASWFEHTEAGYTVEMRIPWGTVIPVTDAPITFDIGIGNSTSAGNDRYEVVSWYGTPNDGYNGSGSFTDSLLLTGGPAAARPKVTVTAGPNGTIEPSGVTRVTSGGNLALTITPDQNYVIDALTVGGATKEATAGEGKYTYTLTDVTADTAVAVTFKKDPLATEFGFIVWNDNFAQGEYTTAVIIDVGEGKTIQRSALNAEMFTVTGKNMRGTSTAYEGIRTIKRVYVNSEAKVLGYKGEVTDSPDYAEGPESGRYIVLEFKWPQSGGVPTLDGTSSTTQVYKIAATGSIAVDGGAPITKAVFTQTKVVNTLIDQFVANADAPSDMSSFFGTML
jgi:hypothetical protein